MTYALLLLFREGTDVGDRRRGVSFSSQDEEIRSTITVRNKIRRKRFAGRDKTNGVDIAERNRRGRSRFFSSEIKFNFVQILYITRAKNLQINC